TQKVTLAGNIGALSLALRNNGDPDAVRPRTLTLNDLVPTPPKKVEEKPAPAPLVKTAPPTIEILRGTDSTTYEVRKDGRVGSTESKPRPSPATPPKARAASAPPSDTQLAKSLNQDDE